MKDLSQLKCFMFDLDGTVNLGDNLIDSLQGFFPALKSAGKTYYMVTNNSSKDAAFYAQKMLRLGIDCPQEQIITPAEALLAYLEKKAPHARLYVVGTAELRQNCLNKGFSISNDLEESSDYVIVGYDKTLTYNTLSTACRLIMRGVPFLATHADTRCPISGGEFIPDAGAILAFIKAVTGQDPTHIFGKPHSYMLDIIQERSGFAKEEMAMVGDRLSTDILFGVQNKVTSILVLTGEATYEDVKTGTIKPDFVFDDASEILLHL